MEITREHIVEAHHRIQPFIHRTPIFSSSSINKLVGARIYFKCENFQKVGAFKIRGAMNAALLLDKLQLQNRLTTHSSGNHAQANSLADKTLGVDAYIVMPSNSPKVKVNAVKNYGAEIFFCEPNQLAREQKVKEIITKTGAALIHPYDNDDVI